MRSDSLSEIPENIVVDEKRIAQNRVSISKYTPRNTKQSRLSESFTETEFDPNEEHNRYPHVDYHKADYLSPQTAMLSETCDESMTVFDQDDRQIGTVSDDTTNNTNINSTSGFILLLKKMI
eukprot:456168_1